MIVDVTYNLALYCCNNIRMKLLKAKHKSVLKMVKIDALLVDSEPIQYKQTKIFPLYDISVDIDL